MAYNVKFLQGSNAAYGAIATKDLNTFYYIDEKDLYLGNIKLSNGADLAAAILRIADNETDIAAIQEELGALTGNDSGQSINQMINAAVDAAKTELNGKITANTTAIETEAERAKGVEGGLETRLAAVEGDYLKSADKTELEGKITAEQQRAEGIENGLNTRLTEVESDIDYFFKDALKDEEGVQAYKDTLKEIQDYINSDAEAAGAMSASIKANADAIDAIEADYLKAADKTELTNAINGKVAQGDFDTLEDRVDAVEGAVATKAEQEALNTVSGKVTVLEGKVDVESVTGAIATAKQEAITAAAGDATTKANTALSDAKTYTNEEIAKLEEVYDKKGAATTALNDAKSYADGVAGTAETNAKAYAKDYADGLAGNYATAAQGTKADSALQVADITTGANNGAIAVRGTDVAVAGLKSAAFVEASAFDGAGMAATAEANAKAYVDGALTWGEI